MAPDSDLPEADHPRAAVSPTGGLPADFFEEPRPGPADSDGATAIASGPLPPRSPSPSGPPAASDAAARRSILPIVGAVLLGNLLLFLAGILAGWALARRSPPPPSPAAPPAPSFPMAEVARIVESRTSKAEAEGLRAQVASLERRLARLQDRPDPPPGPDLAPLLSRIEALAKALDRGPSRAGELDALGRRVGALDEALGTLREQVQSLQAQLKEALASPPKPEAREAPAGEGDALGRALARGAALFKEGQYARARDAFLEQAEATPDDARLWYYAALANGAATRDWRGETERLVKRGIDRERAGTPARAEIDAAFAGLGNEQVAEWLRAWRERAARP
jgi:TolA-binding protein